LLAVLGDQLYENRPTLPTSSSAPTLDYLGKYYLWLWAFRDLTADRPTITLVDDHDVMQGNLWGHSGAAAPKGNLNNGGYVKSPSFINFLQTVQCAHNPDAFDPTPVQQKISVYYCTFRYGCVRFAVVEDRKFKGGDADEKANGKPYNLNSLPLLGARQEAFLQQWANSDPGFFKVCLTQTLWGCLMTSGTTTDLSDSNGSTPAARLRAISLVRSAGGLLLAGDQHLASVVRHGINTFTDGPVQFTAPPAGTSYARWFQPGPLPNSEGRPYTGDYVDAFGNKMHVIAVANPLVSWPAMQAAGGTRDVGDAAIKRDGFGIVRIQPAQQTYQLNCWPAQGAFQYPGWPITLPMDT
jgi:alkaline phosphatase D